MICTASSRGSHFGVYVRFLYAFILGIAYGITFIRSRSVLSPAVMHGVSNFVMVGAGYMFAIVLR
ncbi:MAG: CPBP family intramembrane metalloprotease [Treponema sp.]|nr:CPBP family intramembrane metalloprotease [Treponema sp.]